jgi:hypothetical protein
MHVRHAGSAFAVDGYVLGVAAIVWLAATAWILERITSSLYDAAFAVIRNAAAAIAGGA